MIHLKNPYIQVKDGKRTSFGGNQSWLGSRRLSGYGCGLIAAGDILLYLTGTGRMNETPENAQLCAAAPCDKSRYLAYLGELERKYFYVSYLIRGITGFGLAIGFNRYAAKHKSALRASWGVPAGKIYDAVKKSLERDIPVLFSVGANFPWIFGKRGVTLYEKRDKTYHKSTQTRKHYMTITGIVRDGEMGELFQVSSWGREYYMSRQEYEEYIRRYSMGLLTNILFIWEKKQ